MSPHVEGAGSEKRGKGEARQKAEERHEGWDEEEILRRKQKGNNKRGRKSGE